MYCNAQGHPDPNGDCMMMDGKIVLRPGRSARFDITLMDGKPGATSGGSVFLRDTHTAFTDAEAQLFDSPEGKCIIAHAKMTHRLRTGYLGDRAPEFTDAQAAAVIRSHVEQTNRGRATIAQMTADADTQARLAAQARQDMIAGMNGWRNR